MSEEYYYRLQNMNFTECSQLADAQGLNPPAGATKEELIVSLVDGVSFEEQNVFNKRRLALIEYITDFYSTLKPELKCYAKDIGNPREPDSKPCFKCNNATVTGCYLASKQDIEPYLEKKHGTP